MYEPMTSEIIVQKIKDNSLEASDLDKMFAQLVHRATENALKALPDTVNFLMRQSALINKLSKEFFDRNRHLQNHKEFVVSLIEQVESENPGLDYDKILNKVEKLATKKLPALTQMQNKSTERPSIKNMDNSLGEL